MATQPITPQSGIAGPGNPTGAILPITGNNGTTPTPAQSGYGNPTGTNAQGQTTYGPTISNPLGSTVINGIVTPNNNSPTPYGPVDPLTGSSANPASNPLAPNGDPLSQTGAYNQALSEAQSQIQGTESYYQNLLNQDQIQNQQSTEATRAMNLAAGVAGGGAAAANQNTTTGINNNRTAATMAALSSALTGIYSNIASNAATIESAGQASAEDALKAQQTVQANAVTSAQGFGKQGITGSALQTQDPTTWSQLLQQTGYTPGQLTNVINNALPSQYQPSTQTVPSPSADGKGTTINVITSSINPATGMVQQTQSSYTVAVPFADFNQKGLITASDGTPIYIDADGNAINAETGKQYVPTTTVASGSSLVNSQTGTVMVKGNDKYSVVRVGSDLNGNPVDEVFDATKGTFLGTQNSDGTLAPATTNQVDTTTVPGMTLPAVTESDQLALQYTRSMPTPGGTNVGYIDASGTKLSQQDINSMEAYGKANGLTVITNPSQITSLEGIAAASSDLNSEASSIVDSSGNSLLPANWWTADLGGATANNLSAYLQTDSNKAAFGNYQLSMLDYIKAIAGGGGASGGSSRLVSMLNSGATSQYLPQLTDTLSTAQAKMQIIADDIQSSLDSVLPENSTGSSSGSSGSSTTYSGITLPN